MCVRQRKKVRGQGVYSGGLLKTPRWGWNCRVGDGSLGAQVQKDVAEISLLVGWS